MDLVYGMKIGQVEIETPPIKGPVFRGTCLCIDFRDGQRRRSKLECELTAVRLKSGPILQHVDIQ